MWPILQGILGAKWSESVPEIVRRLREFTRVLVRGGVRVAKPRTALPLFRQEEFDGVCRSALALLRFREGTRGTCVARRAAENGSAGVALAEHASTAGEGERPVGERGGGLAVLVGVLEAAGPRDGTRHVKVADVLTRAIKQIARER